MITIDKKYSIFIVMLMVSMIFLGSALNVNAATKTEKDYKIFSATVPNLGAYINWGVNFKVSGTYSTGSQQYHLGEISANAYIDPKRGTDVGNGSIIASVAETIDSGTKVTRRIAPNPTSFWYGRAEIWSTTAHVYFSKYGNSNKNFKSLAKEQGIYTFTYPSGIVHNPNHSLTLSINGPK